MEIQFVFNKRFFNLAIGYHGARFQQINFITFCEEFYDGKELSLVTMIFRIF
jgi:hypothetical protein